MENTSPAPLSQVRVSGFSRVSSWPEAVHIVASSGSFTPGVSLVQPYWMVFGSGSDAGSSTRTSGEAGETSSW